MALGSRLTMCGLMLTLLVLGACGGTTLGTTTKPGSSTAPGASLTKDVQPVFNANCVVCHQGAGQAGLSLEPGLAYNNLVNVKSTESPLMRVSPGAPDKSYLINKLLGNQAQAGGSGAQMPFNAPALPQAQISLIQQWITLGAPNN